MKKFIICALAAVSVAVLLSSCGSYKCNMCNEKCSDKYSYKDGEVILCKDCYKACFEEKTEIDPEVFFGTETVAE